jgi:hypothetical protein
LATDELATFAGLAVFSKALSASSITIATHLRDLRLFDGQLLGDRGNPLFTVQVTSNDSGLLYSYCTLGDLL